MKEGEIEEDVDIRIEIPPYIIKNILENNRKRKADGSIDHRPCKAHTSSQNRCCDTAEMPTVEKLGDVEGDRQAMLEEYCNWGLAQVESDRWRQALQIANQVAIEQFLELNTILQYPEAIVKLMVKNEVAPGIALQFVSNIKKFQREIGKS